jgi:hypothetical protein
MLRYHINDLNQSTQSPNLQYQTILPASRFCCDSTPNWDLARSSVRKLRPMAFRMPARERFLTFIHWDIHRFSNSTGRTLLSLLHNTIAPMRSAGGRLAEAALAGMVLCRLAGGVGST